MDEPTAVVADDYLFQVAVYRGDEELVSDGVTANKVYWNVALGVTGDIGDCELRARGTADDADDPDDGMDGGVVAQGAVYPYVRWRVPLDTCVAEALTFDGAGTVQATYTATTASAPEGFGYGFAPGLPPAAVCTDGCVHGTCTAADTCTCDPGYEGPTCAVDHDDCSPNPCLNGGSCADGVDSFTCTCATGYEGPTCAVDHDDCSPNPCLNGGSCADGVDSFTCTCVGSWTGPTCETSTGPPQKMNLTGGAFNRNASYTAANGVTVTSSAPTYSNSTYYYLAYLFNGTYSTSPTQYWLTSSTGNQTLTIDFHTPTTLEYVRVYPTTISDRKSNYQLHAWNGSAWVDVAGGWVTTTSDSVGSYRDHASAALTNTSRIRFTLSRVQNWGVTLTEVELYYYP